MCISEVYAWIWVDTCSLFDCHYWSTDSDLGDEISSGVTGWKKWRDEDQVMWFRIHKFEKNVGVWKWSFLESIWLMFVSFCLISSRLTARIIVPSRFLILRDWNRLIVIQSTANCYSWCKLIDYHQFQFQFQFQFWGSFSTRFTNFVNQHRWRVSLWIVIIDKRLQEGCDQRLIVFVSKFYPLIRGKIRTNFDLRRSLGRFISPKRN